MAGGPHRALPPALRMMSVVLTNGAVVQMPTAAIKTRPFLATTDLFQHGAWAVKLAGAQAAEPERAKRFDFASFYQRFGGGGLDDDDGGVDDGGAEQQQQQQQQQQQESNSGGRGGSTGGSSRRRG